MFSNLAHFHAYFEHMWPWFWDPFFAHIKILFLKISGVTLILHKGEPIDMKGGVCHIFSYIHN
jgi:hypothetical protein